MLFRKLLDHPLMNQLPAAWFRVFVVILLKANWKPGTWWDGRQEITIPAGSMVTSIEKLSKLAGASKRQTRGARVSGGGSHRDKQDDKQILDPNCCQLGGLPES